MGKLTVSKIRKIDRAGMFGDGDTLYLNVLPTGGKSWIQRIAVDGKRRDIGLGPWPLVSLAEARDAAIDNRRLIRGGRQPACRQGTAAENPDIPGSSRSGPCHEPGALARRANRNRTGAASSIATPFRPLATCPFPISAETMY